MTQDTHSQLTLRTQVREVPPVAPTLGAGGGRQSNMDGELCPLLHLALGEGLPKDRAVQLSIEYTDFLHGLVLKDIPCIHLDL
jgi:hypothetical protein